ncbi:Cys-Gln thioester bond-forming surface protein [Actinophytocola xanthii]|nr:Cys-Gln thioester bond-forming surface protein [Actinophytocola xanthii]
MLRFARACAGIAGTAAALIVATAVPAGAEPASGLVNRDADVQGFAVDVGEDVFAELDTSLIGFKLADGSELGMYCVEIQTEIDEEHPLVEQPWDAFPVEDSPFNENQGKINWVLHNGFPVQDTGALAEMLADDGTLPNGGIDEREAVTATQAAVWHFSDGVDLDRENPLPGNDSDADAAADVLALYDLLTGAANEGIGEQPPAALEIDPASAKGTAGEMIGPFTVTTTGTIDKINADLPEDVRLTDGTGRELGADIVKNGTELFLDVDANAPAGSASFELAATASVETGRLFVGENYDEAPTQALIVAKSVDTQLTATAEAEWAAAPPESSTEAAPVAQAKNDDLATTGASVFAPILFGAALVAAGIFAVLFVRYRRNY